MLENLGMKTRTAVVELENGRQVRMRFDMGMLANAESAYEDHFGRSMGVNEIIAELVMGRTRALMAMAYGAMMSADEKITWKDFAENIYTFEHFQRISDTITAAIASMSRSDEDGEEGAGKNAHSRGES